MRGSSKVAGADAEARQPSANQTSVQGEGGAHAGGATLPTAGVEPAALSARASPKSAAVRKDSSPALRERELHSSVSEILRDSATASSTEVPAAESEREAEQAAAPEVGGTSPPETARVLMTSAQRLSMTGFVMSGCQKGCTAPEGCSTSDRAALQRVVTSFSSSRSRRCGWRCRSYGDLPAGTALSTRQHACGISHAPSAWPMSASLHRKVKHARDRARVKDLCKRRAGAGIRESDIVGAQEPMPELPDIPEPDATTGTEYLVPDGPMLDPWVSGMDPSASQERWAQCQVCAVQHKPRCAIPACGWPAWPGAQTCGPLHRQLLQTQLGDEGLCPNCSRYHGAAFEAQYEKVAADSIQDWFAVAGQQMEDFGGAGSCVIAAVLQLPEPDRTGDGAARQAWDKVRRDLPAFVKRHMDVGTDMHSWLSTEMQEIIPKPLTVTEYVRDTLECKGVGRARSVRAAGAPTGQHGLDRELHGRG